MNTKIKVELGDIQKTLLMPVWARADETNKLLGKPETTIENWINLKFKKNLK